MNYHVGSTSIKDLSAKSIIDIPIFKDFDCIPSRGIRLLV
nr:GrpB family protein [Bacillus sp. FJAT-18017]